MIRKIDLVNVTYYVNPHHFYFKYADDPIGESKLKTINNNVEKYVHRHIEQRHSIPHSPKIGEIVLCHYLSDCVDKWIRARVDAKLTYAKEMFILWALDYGFPLESEARWIRPLLSEELKLFEKGVIFKGGLFEIVPSTVEWDFIQSAEESRKTKKWSSKAVQSVEKYIHQADNLTFRCRAYFEDHFFGSLIIQSNTGTKMVVEDFLGSLREGVDSVNFLKEFSKLENQPYWERQKQDAIYKVYDNNSDHTMDEDVNVTSLLNATDDKIKFDLPKLQNTKPKINDDTDETLIKLSDQLQTATKLPSQNKKIASNLRKIQPVPVDQTASHREDIGPKLMDANGCFNEDGTLRVVPMNQRLVVAQQKIVEQGFIVDNNAIEEKLKFNRNRDGETVSDSTKSKKTHYMKARENEECFSVNHMQRILVHSHENIPIMPINDIHDANFSQEVHAALKHLNINQIYRIQTVGWPRLLRGSSMIIVNSPRAGKTWTYLPAICSLIIERIQDNQVVDGCGPLSIIACASSQTVNETTKYCEDLLRYTTYGIRCFKAYGFSDETNVVSQLLNGTEILVTTVPCLHRLMVNELQLFNRKRIISLVFDNIDLVYKQFSREIYEIRRSLCDPTSDVQMIITSRTCLKVLEQFYIESDRVAFCIGSYIEAAVYGRTEMTIELLGQKLKIDKLISYLGGINYRHELTFVICNTTKDVKDLLKQLESTPIKSWNCHDESDSSEIIKIKKLIDMCRGDYKLLICTDEIVCDLNIRCAQHILHFSLPSTWTKFTFRFSVLFDQHENLLVKENNRKPAATSVVFLDENNNDELPRLIDFMQMRGNCDIPEPVLKLAELKRIDNEEKRTNIYKLFCNDLLTIGVCHGLVTCCHRHILTKFDRSRMDIPQTGFVKFDIIGVHSPVHFTVRLSEHRLPYETKWTTLQTTDEILSFNMELMKYFEDDENHEIHFPFKLGDLCVVAVENEGGKRYERGKIVKIEEKLFIAVLKQYWVEILLIDTNDRTSCFSTELKQLPDKFKTFLHQAVDIRIADLRPRDFDCEWDSKILAHVKKWIRNENPKSTHYYQGLIKLSIMDTLWVDSIDIIEILQSINEEVTAVSIKKNLLEGNFCVKDTKPLELMMDLAKNADIVDRSGFESAQIVDRRTTKDLPAFNNSRSSSIDLDESDISKLNWTTSTDDDDDVDPEKSNAPLDESLKNSSTSSAQEEDLLRLSKDKWAELTSTQWNKIFLCNFYHPERIYIRNHSYSSRLMDLNKRIDAFTAVPTNLIQLPNIVLAENCLAKIFNNFSRAKIMKIFHDTDDITAEVFFVDLGEFVVLPVNELIEIPLKFITALPFQAIFCKLIGVRPNDPPKWCETICDNIYDNLLVKQPHFYARSMRLGGPDKYAYGLKSRSYQVVLLDETGNNVNNWIALNHYGELDPDTKHYIDVVVDGNMLKLLNSDSSEESDCFDNHNISLIKDPRYNGPDNEDDDLYGDFDVQFDDDDIMKLLQLNQIPLSCEKRIEPPPAQITEIHEEANAIQVVDEQLGEKNSLIESSLPVTVDEIETAAVLVSLHKFPKIKWHQSKTKVVLNVYAPDVANYHLKITPRLLNICFMKDQEKFAAVLNLFGCIDVEYTTHGIRGLNIVIRLDKTLSRVSWPRLVQAKEKCHWLQYDFDAKSEESKEFDLKETKNEFAVTHHQNNSESSCSDAESVHDAEIDLDN